MKCSADGPQTICVWIGKPHRSICTDAFDEAVKTASGTLTAAAAGEPIGMGWTSPTWDGLWAALICKARNPQKFEMDVSYVAVVDCLGYLVRSMIINWTGHIEEHIYASERKGEMIYCVVDPQAERLTTSERLQLRRVL